VFVGLTTAANAGVGEEQAGLAAGLLNTGQQLGTALGLAILSALATARTTDLLGAGHDLAQAATAGYQRGLLGGALLVVAGGALTLVAAPNRRPSTQAAEAGSQPALDSAA
jgi:hypothetical protein